jgi:RNA polymerase sigma-70 factor (subfamily 1)
MHRGTSSSSLDSTAARTGDADSHVAGLPPANLDQTVGSWLEACRDYLQLIANRELPDEVRPKCAPSDVVQLTITEAWQSFAEFRGQSEAELRGWLKRILVNNIRDATRKYRDTAKRGVAREVPLTGAGSKDVLIHQIPAPDKSPSANAAAQEDLTQLKEALSELPPHYAEVIRLRNLEDLPFSEIGRQLCLTADSARKLWERAVRRLAKELKQRHDPT